MKDPAEYLEKFLVGGAVRDKILGEPPGDKDWVVIGATEKKMKELGFKSVGKDFPVFLHPKTGEEYALARRERKVAKGYRGFKFDSASTVTLVEDLARRDLTVNAIAQDSDGKLIDPFGGIADLKAGKLRHVSSAFVEDPVRVLRVARFAARFSRKGFQVTGKTESLIQKMVKNKEIDSLVPERIWLEFVSALGESHPSIFFKVLRRTGALASVLPEIESLFELSHVHPTGYHEQNVGKCALLAVDASASVTSDTRVRFAALVHDLEKGIQAQNPHEHDHELAGATQVRSLCSRLRVPTGFRELALTVAEHYQPMINLASSSTDEILRLLTRLNVFRDLDRVKSFVIACESANSVRTNSESLNLVAELLICYAEAARNVDLTDLDTSIPDGQRRGNEVKERRLIAIANAHDKWKRVNLV